MKKMTIKKAGISFFAICMLIAGNCFKTYADERGCLTTPNNNHGDCEKNTEGIWNCIPATFFTNCSASQ